MIRRVVIRSAILLLVLCPFLLTEAYAQSCEKIVRDVNVRLSPGIDEQELIEIIRNLNNTGNQKLPAKFVNKQAARIKGMETRQGSVVRERPQRLQHRRRPVSKQGEKLTR